MWSSFWDVLSARRISPSNANRQVAGATEPGAKATKSMVHPLLQLGMATATNHRRARRIQRRMGNDTNKVPNIQKSIMERIFDPRRVYRGWGVLSAVLDDGTFKCLHITATGAKVENGSSRLVGFTSLN